MPIKVAYIILAHKNPVQLERLVSRLSSEDVALYVHIDKSVRLTDFSDCLDRSEGKPRVSWLRQEYTPWGRFGLVQAILNGICRVLGDHPGFGHIVLLSGQDYPIKPNTYIHEYLDQRPGICFVDHFKMPGATWPPDGGLSRIERYHLSLLGKDLVFPPRRRLGVLSSILDAHFRRRFPSGLVPYGGSLWWCIDGSCAQCIMDFLNERPDVVRFYQYCKSSDEMFFQTVLLNSPLRDIVLNRSLTYVDWSQDLPNPSVLTCRNFDSLVTSDCLFARKFDMNLDAGVLDLIDERLLRDQ